MSAPLQDGWIDYDGKGCPVQPGTLVDWRIRNGSEFSGREHPRFRLDWSHDPERADNDIIAYREVKP